MSYHLLEVNRISASNSNESNFNIFYALLMGSSNDLLHSIYLDPLPSYKVRKTNIFVSHVKRTHNMNFCY